jgi:hypothetical protein
VNFGKHGRTILMSALLAATSTVVFSGLVPGVASASPGTIKVGGYPADNSGNANDPHIDTACVGVRTFGMDPTKPVTATFSLQAPTKANLAPLTVTTTPAEGVFPVDVTNWLSAIPANKQGYHVNVDVDGKQKTFWVSDLSTGCPKKTCTVNGQPFGASLPSDPLTAPIEAGSGVGVAFTTPQTPAQVNALAVKIDGTTVTGQFWSGTDANGNATDLYYILPAGFPAGSHTMTLQVGNQPPDCTTKTINFTSVALGGTTS